MPTKGLKNIFYPNTVAVIGASNKKDSVGYAIMSNLIGHGFKGTIYPVNQKHDSIQGVHAYQSVSEIPRQIDLAIIATPAATVPAIMDECGKKGVKGAVIISAGFKEAGEEGRKREQEVAAAAAKHDIRIIGPNCLGVINPRHRLNASFAIKMPEEGNIAFISQSGALCSSIIDWADGRGIGFSYFVSIGSMLDVDYGDLIDFFGRDPKTKSIVVYMESVKNAKKFMSAASGFAINKPIVIVKSGRFEEGRKAVVSHTGAIAGSDDVYSAAFKRAGVVRVKEIDDLFDISEKLAKGPLPKGPRIAVITNAGGPGVMAVDKIIEEKGSLAELDEETIKKLDGGLPPAWSRNNPIDLLGDAGPDRYRHALDVCIRNRDVDSIAVILTPQSGTNPTEIAKVVADSWAGTDKPITACWMGGPAVAEARKLLRERGIAVYSTPEKAVMPLISGYNYLHNLELLHETPQELTRGISPDKARLRRIIDENVSKGVYVLSERESKEFLMEYGLTTNHAALARTREDAVKAANNAGYPVVLKIESPHITHKTDAGGVMLSLYTGKEVEDAFDRIMENARRYNPNAELKGAAVMPMVIDRGFELLLGSKRDEVFGQVVVFGAGGTLVETLRDKSIGLPPLNQTLVRRMMEETRLYSILKNGSRDRKPANLLEVEKAIINFSQLITDFPEVTEVDVNPLLATGERCIALDARIVLDKEAWKTDHEHLCILPYPKEYTEEYRLKDGDTAVLRAIKAEDEPKVKDLFKSFSEKTMHYRFFYTIKDITHEMLVRYCHTDYDREITVVAEHGGILVGMSRLMYDPGESKAEFSVVVTDSWQNKGLGFKLVEKIVDIGRRKKLETVYATVIKENSAMKHVAEKLGFVVETTEDPQIDKLTLDMRGEKR